VAQSERDKIEGFLEIGTANGEVIVNHPDLKPDENGVGHIVFSPNQARNLGGLLYKHADLAQRESDPTGQWTLGVTMQMLADAGLNPFALQLFADSVAGKKDAKTFERFAFIYRGIRISMEPIGEVDTSHY
jgi:hypothetical protein